MSEMREQQSFRRRVRRDRVRSLLSEDSQGAGSTADALESLIDLATGLAVGFMLEGSGGFADDSAADPGPSAYSTLAWKETVNLLLAELESLPDREQTIIRQHYIVGLNFDQIADGLQVSRGRVSQLHRSGLARLRVRLGATEPFFLTK
jgi:RNA polymerase sigma factor for flagellar operon FliA